MLHSSNRLEDFVVQKTRSQLGESTLSPTLPFDVTKHPSAKSHVAQDMIGRMAQDVSDYATSMNGGKVNISYHAKLDNSALAHTPNT